MADFTFGADGLYRDAAGRAVSDARVRAAVDAIADGAASRMAASAQALLDGTLSLAAFQADLMRTIKTAHVAAAVIGGGGAASMTPTDWLFSARAIKEQYAYARAFAEAVADGSQPLDGTLRSRAAQYGHAARTHYKNEQARMMEGRGMRCRNVLHASESCAGCRAESAKGWVPVGALVPIGSRSPCQSRCRCSITYSRAQEAAA